eukprot:TRINITY_DN3284_c0_g1_i3.p1 TRINITY_DN3284_c0_g1~~TRINITY_DN3284_c0_g1_i3.p1  ORF type:complete len:378 (+),score=74.80 TRINITY_DN3284_c0_g1_i3:95-1135(+)
MALRKVPQEIADHTGGYCLDGSVPGYYFRQGTESNKWRIHLRGGGWCWTVDDCASRAKSDLGSSLYFEEHFCATVNIAEGFMDAVQDENPFAEWNLVFWMYCGGSSHTSDREEPLQAPDGTKLWFRERRVAYAILADLQRIGSLLTSATDVVLTGTSAGALSAFGLAPVLAGFLPETTNFAVMPDSGFFMDYPTYAGVNEFRDNFANAMKPDLWNATQGLDPQCQYHFAQDEQWKCFFPQYVLPLMDTPRVRFFLPQSMADTWQVQNILQLGCEPNVQGDCTKQQLAAFNDFQANLTTAVVQAVKLHPDRDGLFLTSCYQHGQTDAHPTQCSTRGTTKTPARDPGF